MLKIYGLYICTTLCLLFVQSNAILPLGNHGIRPDLLLFLVLWASISVPAVHCACIIVIIGYVFESLSGSPSGLFISTYLLVFGTISLLRRFFDFNTLVEQFSLLLVCLIVKYLLLCFFLCFIYEYHYDYMLQTIFRETLFTVIFFPLIFPLIRNYINPKGVLAANTHSHGA
jgi:cell shape-determining protein MreD